MEDNFDLNEMKTQIGLLKEKLDNQTIINDKLLRNSMKDKISSINNRTWITYCSAIFVVTFGNIIWYNIGMSWLFIGVTTVMMLVSVFFTYLIHSKMSTTDAMYGDLLTVAKNAKKIKQQYGTWLKCALPVMVLWLGWFSFEILQNQEDHTGALIMLCGALVGGTIGGIIGYSQHRKVVNTCDEIIRQIED